MCMEILEPLLGFASYLSFTRETPLVQNPSGVKALDYTSQTKHHKCFLGRRPLSYGLLPVLNSKNQHVSQS